MAYSGLYEIHMHFLNADISLIVYLGHKWRKTKNVCFLWRIFNVNEPERTSPKGSALADNLEKNGRKLGDNNKNQNFLVKKDCTNKV